MTPTTPVTTPSVAPDIMKFGNDVVVPEPSATNTQNYTVLDSDLAKNDYLTKNKFLNQEQQRIINQSLVNQTNKTNETQANNETSSINSNTDALNKATGALSNGQDSNSGNTGDTTQQNTKGQNLTTASGNTYVGSGDPYNDSLLAQNADTAAMYKSTQDALTKASTIAGLSSDQQSQLNSLASQYDTIISQQDQANSFYNGAVTMGTIRSGSNRYATAIAASTVTQAVNEGIAKITTLQNQKSSALQKMQEGFISDNVTAVNDAYKAYSDAAKQQTDNIKAMQDHVDALHTQQVADLNLALNQKNYDLNVQQKQQTFNNDMGITSPFYQLPGSPKVYDSKTGQEITSDQYAQMGGVGQDSGYSDIQVVDPSANAKHSAIYTEWKDAVSTGYKGSFTQYENEDANRKASAASNADSIGNQTKNYDLQVKQAPSQVSKLKDQGYTWQQIADYFTNLNIDPGTPAIDDALHRAFNSTSDYQSWKASNYNTNHGVAQ